MKTPFKIPDPAGGGVTTRDLDDFRQDVSAKLEERDVRILDVESKIAKPGIRGGFNIDDIRSYGTIQDAVAAIPSTQNKTLFLTNTQAITDNLTIPANISIVALFGGSFVISSGKTLTINGSFHPQGSNLADLFSGSGAYVFGKAVHLFGGGTPEGVVSAPVGSLFQRNNGAAQTIVYCKESGTGNTGWVAILTWNGSTFVLPGNMTLGTVAAGALLTLIGKTGFSNDYLLDNSATAGTLEIRLNSAAERYVSLVNSGTGTLSLLVDGRINVRGAADTPNYAVNAGDGFIATRASYGHRAYGLGGPGDANTEFLEFYHDGSINRASIDSNKTGSGSVRNLILRTGGSAAITIDAAQAAAFAAGISSLPSLAGGFYEENTYTGALTGMTTSPTTTVRWTRIGNSVTLHIDAASATSNANTFTITGMPASIRPARDKEGFIAFVINGGISEIGVCIVRTTGVIEFYRTGVAAAPGAVIPVVFDTSGTKGIAGAPLGYNLL